MAAPATTAPAGTLINYRVEGGLAWIEMNDPPANTYTHEMMLQLDTAILRARFDGEVHVIIGRKILFCGRQHQNVGQRDAGIQILFLPARQRNLNAP